LLVTLFISSVLSYITPCGRCLGKGEVCSPGYPSTGLDTCRSGFNCVQLKNTLAHICLPTASRHEWCNNTKDYDPCDKYFACDPRSGKCEISTKGRAYRNDGCENNDYCATGLSCVDKACKPSQPDGQCNSATECGWYEYCDATTTPKRCRPLPDVGGQCGSSYGLSFQTCQYLSSCVDGICVAHYSIPEGGKCKFGNVALCQPGLACEEEKCVKPTYQMLLGFGSAWGGDCVPGLPGCKCNYYTNTMMYKKEVSKTHRDFCPQRLKDFKKCLTDHGCSHINDFADSCMRKYCYGIYTIVDQCYYDDATNPDRCAGNSLYVFINLLVVLLIFLF